MINVLVAGCNGMLGQNLVFTNTQNARIFGVDVHGEGIAIDAPYYKQSDMTVQKNVLDLCAEIKPDVIINAAAFTNVDKAESEPEQCRALNVDMVKHLVLAVETYGGKLVHVSTDYIFDGINGPYTEEDAPNPLGFYGKSKLEGESVILSSNIDFVIARTMVLYGKTLNHRNHFVNWLVGELQAGNNVRIVKDQYGNTTLASELAGGIWRTIDTGYKGILNIAGSEIVNRYEFARIIANVFDLNEKLIIPITTAELKQPALRPLNSGLVVDKAVNELYIELSDVKTALCKYRDQ